MTPVFSDKWNYYFIEFALFIANLSKDPNTQVGCIVVGPDKEIRSTGYNGMPRGVNDDVPERNIRPLKYLFYEHSERNAIYNASLCGVSLKGCTLYVTMPPCADCARAIINSGIKRVYYLEPYGDKIRKGKNGNWRDSLPYTQEMFKEASIEYIALDHNKVFKDFSKLFKQKMFSIIVLQLIRENHFLINSDIIKLMRNLFALLTKKMKQLEDKNNDLQTENDILSVSLQLIEQIQLLIKKKLEDNQKQQGF